MTVFNKTTLYTAHTQRSRVADDRTYPSISSKASRKRVAPRKEILEQNRIRIGFEKKLNRQLMKSFRKVGKQARSEYEAVGGLVSTPRQGLSDIRDILTNHYRAVIEEFGLRMVRDNKQDSQFEMIIRDYINRVGGDRIVNINNTTMQRIRRVISLGEKEGLGVAVIGKNIFDTMGGAFSRSRSATIARTETHNAASFANHQVNASFGIPNQKKRWVSVSDDRTRSHHSQMNGVEVGIDEDFIVNGIPMGYAGDPRGGAGNIINCRCVILYVTPEDEVFVDETTTVAQKPIKRPLPERNITSPIEPLVTIQTFNMVTRLDAQKALTKEFAEAGKDDRYFNKKIRHFRGRTANDFGKARFSTEFKDVSVAIIAGIKPELDEIADRFDIPRLRGFKSGTGNYGANQGDGVMQINPRSINRDAAGVMGSRLSSEAREARLKELDDEIFSLEPQIEDARLVLSAIYTKYDDDLHKLRVKAKIDGDPEAIADLEAYNKTNKLINRLRDEQNNLKILVSDLENDNSRQISTWDTSKPQKEKPRFADAYLDTGFDRIRQLMYHEMGHHVHENIAKRIRPDFDSQGGKVEPNFKQVRHPLEEYLSKNRHKFINPEGKQRQYSSYAHTNHYEWFAENFSLYWMGVRDKVDPVFVELIEKLLTDKDFVESL